jgi:glycosyltransferase involved in cell wall biosynthesis
MRILFLSTWFPFPPDNGSKLRAHYLLQALAKYHNVTVLAFYWDEDQDPSQIRELPQGMQVYAVRASPYRYVELPFMVKFASPMPLAFWPSRAMRKTLDRLRKSQRWDAVVAFESPVGQYVLSLPIPRVLDIDTALSYQMHERLLQKSEPIARLRAFVSWQKAHLYEAFLMRRFQAVTVVSNQELDFLRSMVSHSACRVIVNSNGVDCTHNRQGLARPTPYTLVYNGSLTYSANYDAMQFFLKDIYPLLRTRFPDTSLTITGSTSGVDVSDLALDSNVRLSGYVEDIRPVVASAWVCVIPIRQGWGTRIKILEAMALGTPVVATSKGAEGLNVTHERDILIADAPDEFVTQVSRLFENSELRRHLVTNARRLVERDYDWSTIGKQFTNLVEDVVKDHRGRI